MAVRLLLALCAATAAAAVSFNGPLHPTHGISPAMLRGKPSSADCSTVWVDQKLDHFNFGTDSKTFKQRYMVCLKKNWRPDGTIFFYPGNEGNVEGFINNTGLMWESAPEFAATLVFAEHRFFGESLPYPGEAMPAPSKLKNLLTPDQAMADYISIIETIREQWSARNSAVIGFGGSYGGMLCAWMRIRYPNTLDGCIAGSAPLRFFPGMHPPIDPTAAAKISTMDATAAGGSAPRCAANIRQAWVDMMNTSTSDLSNIFQTCTPLTEAVILRDVLASPVILLSEAAYPFPSNYFLLGGPGMFPPYPLRVLCDSLADDFGTDSSARLAALAKGLMVYYNASGNFKCIDYAGKVNKGTEVTMYLWGYLTCTTMVVVDAFNGKTDMFFENPFSLAAFTANCQKRFGITPQWQWPQLQFGGAASGFWGSNIVFSNGELDPVRAGGVFNVTSESVESIVIPQAGHHADLFFSTPMDTPGMRAARDLERRMIRKWIANKPNHG